MIDFEPFYRAVSRGNGQAFLDGHPEYCTQEVAARLRNAVGDAMAAGMEWQVQLIASAAGDVCARIGDAEGLACSHVDFLQVEFMAATQREEYAKVRAQVLDLRGRAQNAGLTAVVFRTAVLAADCSYFAATEAESRARDAKDTDALAALRDVVDAVEHLGLPFLREADNQGWIERLVSLAAATAELGMSRLWSDNRQKFVADTLLRRLARAVDEYVPVDFSVERRGDAENTDRVAAAFARLADAYG